MEGILFLIQALFGLFLFGASMFVMVYGSLLLVYTLFGNKVGNITNILANILAFSTLLISRKSRKKGW